MLTLKCTFFKIFIQGKHFVQIVGCVSSQGKDYSRKEKVGWTKKHFDFRVPHSHT